MEAVITSVFFLACSSLILLDHLVDETERKQRHADQSSDMQLYCGPSLLDVDISSPDAARRSQEHEPHDYFAERARRGQRLYVPWRGLKYRFPLGLSLSDLGNWGDRLGLVTLVCFSDGNPTLPYLCPVGTLEKSLSRKPQCVSAMSHVYQSGLETDCYS